MSAHPNEVDELVPTQTEGYKVSEKKTLSEYKELDANDESLNKWKASLGLGKAQGSGPSDDTRKVVVLALILEVAGRENVVMDLSSPSAVEALKDRVVVIKEGISYTLKAQFKIQHDVVTGLKFLQGVKRKGIPVDRTEEMVGSFGPSSEAYEMKLLTEEAPSGMLARGKYTVRSKFIDDDNTCHLEWVWSMEIKKDWQ